MPGRPPPRNVPTLTEVVQPAAAAPGAAPLQEDQMIHRVMQRVDMVLERRLREAVAATVLEQTRNLVPLLREEIEALVREAVTEAFAEELEPKPRDR